MWEPTLFAEANDTDDAKGLSSQPVGGGPMTRAEKVALFRSLFVGREDVYALRWENASTRKTGWSPAVKGGSVLFLGGDKTGRVERLVQVGSPLADDLYDDDLWEIGEEGLI